MTKIADVIVPEVFNKYVTERTAELSVLVQSGIIVPDSNLDVLATAGGRLINMPYWNDLDGDDELLSDSKPLTPAKITAGQDMAALLLRGRAWKANDLAKALSGDDPMRAIGDLVAAYWARQRQKTLLSTLEGTFLAPTMAKNIHDASAEAISAEGFLDAMYVMGDAEEKLTATAMHSATFAALRKQNLIEFIMDSENKPFPTYMGKRVIVDDGMPRTEEGVYTTYLFGAGAIGQGNGAAPVPTETDRDALAGEDILINRQHFILHPRGVAFQDSTVAGASPTNLELAKAANWKRVYQPKNIRLVAYKHTLA